MDPRGQISKKGLNVGARLVDEVDEHLAGVVLPPNGVDRGERLPGPPMVGHDHRDAGMAVRRAARVQGAQASGTHPWELGLASTDARWSRSSAQRSVGGVQNRSDGDVRSPRGRVT